MIVFKPKCVLLVAMALAALVECYGQEKLEGFPELSLTWTEFRSEEGRFRVLMPERPKAEVLTYESAQGRLVHNSFSVEKGGFIWTVNYVDLQPQWFDVTDAVKFLNEARDQVVRETGGTLKDQRSLTLDGLPGVEIKLGLEGGVGRFRFYLVGNRLYQLIVTRIDMLSTSDEAMDKFLDSFKIINQKPQTAMREPARPLVLTTRVLHRID